MGAGGLLDCVNLQDIASDIVLILGFVCDTCDCVRVFVFVVC